MTVLDLQSVYSAFTASFKYKIASTMETIPHVSEYLKQSDDFIDKSSISALVNGRVT